MSTRTFRIVAYTASASAFFAIMLATPTLAKDYFLTIGGGYDPTGNQASLENNVLFLQRVLETRRPDRPRHDLYFADDDAPERDVQYLDPDARKNCPPARRIMTEIFGEEGAVGLRYRNHRIPDVTGPAEKGAIARRFRQLGRKLQAGDRLIVYATGHGQQSYDNMEYDYKQEEWVPKSNEGEADLKYSQYNTSLYLWDNDDVEAMEFARWLDRLPSQVTVVLVMVQCYSGGFSHAIFHQNDAELGLSTRRRCGFFSQVHDRPSAGCTPEVHEADYEEYSTYFWAALGGKSRTGEAIEPPDYDGDGKVSFAEAHAYVVVESDTIDIPVRTSDEFLRRYSRLPGQPRPNRREERAGENPVGLLLGALSKDADRVDPELLGASGPLKDLSLKARPDQRVILERLPQELGLAETTTVEAARQRLRRAESAVNTATAELGIAEKTIERTLGDLQRDVGQLWPELAVSFTPTAAELTNERSEEFVKAVEDLASYDAHRAAMDRQRELTDKLLATQQQEAKAQRLIRTIESVVLAANLPKAAPEVVVARYEELINLEEQSLE